MKTYFLPTIAIMLLMIFQDGYSQSFKTEETVFTRDSINIKAKYCIPDGEKKPPAVLIIAGSGPTDMNGNNMFIKNNHLKLLAEALAKEDIATLRYNKRIIPANQNEIKEESLSFEDFVDDAVFLLKELKEDKSFGKIYVLGHSQGGLIATLAAQEVKVKGLILVAAAGKPIHEIIIEQLRTNSEELARQAEIITDSLMAGHEVKEINPLLQSLFRKSVQGFLTSWMKYDPAEELREIKAKKLIIQGERDIQVSRENALRLEEQNPKADLYFIGEMNHILKNAPEDKQENIKTYSDPDLPVNSKLIEILNGYIK